MVGTKRVLCIHRASAMDIVGKGIAVAGLLNPSKPGIQVPIMAFALWGSTQSAVVASDIAVASLLNPCESGIQAPIMSFALWPHNPQL